MKLLRITTIAQAYLDKFFKMNSDLVNKSSGEQLASLFYDSYAQSDSYSYYLKKYGYECREIVVNSQQIQKAWCRESSIPWNEMEYAENLPIEFAKRFKPEIVFLNDINILNHKWVEELKYACPSVRLVVGFCGILPASYDCLRGYDIVLTPVQYLARLFAGAGLPTRILPHAFDPRILNRIDTQRPKSFPISFIGSVIRINDFHKSRASFLEEISEEYPLTIFTNSGIDPVLKQLVRASSYEVFSKLRKMGVSDAVLSRVPLIGRYAPLKERPKIQKEHRLWSKVRPPVYGLEMYEALVQSRVTLNAHAECAGNSAGNIRLFEATGVGTCLLTDSKDDLNQLFEPDVEVVTYKSTEECKDKLKWLFEHPSETEKIGRAGMNRTLKSHSYENRAEELHKLFKQNC